MNRNRLCRVYGVEEQGVALLQQLQSEDQVRRAQMGEPGAFDTLVEPHLPRLYRVAYLITHQGEAAADALQEALLRAYRALGNLRPDEPFYPWFTRIVVNEAIRQSQRQWDPPLLPLPESLHTPESLLVQKEEQERLWRAVQGLKPIYRAVVVLRYYEDLSEAEMAEILELPPGTVKSRLHHARRLLERKLAPERRWWPGFVTTVVQGGVRDE